MTSRDLDLTLACGHYDRTVALADGSVRPEGVRLDVRWMEPMELFARQVRSAEFDVAEMSLSSYAMLLASGDRRFVALPAFLARVFRHSAVYVNAAAGIRQPRDLIGRRVGVQDYQQTAAVWVRGFLQDDHGVRPEEIAWYVGSFARPGPFVERMPVDLPQGVVRHRIPEDRSLDDLLQSGEIDALIGATPPPSFVAGAASVTRLFANVREVELSYFRRTEIFPIMHLVIARRDLCDRAPWLAASLYAAFVEAKRIALERLHVRTAVSCMVPWLDLHLEEDTRALGPDPFTYGVSANRHVLGTFLRYARDQGLLARPQEIDALFHPDTLDR